MLASIQHFTKLRRLWLVASKYFKKVSILHKNEYIWTSSLQTHYYPSKDETHWCVFQLYQDSNSRQLVGKAWKLPLSFFAITPLKKVVSVIYQLLNVGLFRNSSQPSISLFLALTFFSLSLEKEKKFFFLPQAFVYFTSSTLFSIYLFHFDGFGVFNRVPRLCAHWLRLRDAKDIRRNWRKASWLVLGCR